MSFKNLLQIFTAAVVFLSSTTSAFAKGLAIDNLSLKDFAISNLNYIAAEQVPAADGLYQAGEFPTEIHSTILPAALGVGKIVGHDQEASAFTTASVINVLATIYLQFPKLRSEKAVSNIREMTNKAVPTFELYREGDMYNFYPPREWNGKHVHQPIDMFLTPMWKGFTNVPEDADTTSSVYAAKLYQAQMNGTSFKIPEQFFNSLQEFRDFNRKPQFYNRRAERIETGAFMTWMADEKDQNAPRFWFASPDKGTRIPFNKNDVDCIVNVNVLRMLALNGSKDEPGRAAACEMINDMIKKEEHPTCGIYYPNTYNLAYSSSELAKAGESCLEQDRKKQTVEYILQRQSVDGSWVNVHNDWIDRVQSTAFAMNTLLEFGDKEDPRVRNSLFYAARFLMLNASVSKNGDRYWKGELFFTATAIARSLIAWKSNSFTTAVAAAALLKMHQRYPQLLVKDYLDMN
jgi:hypothetical protein